MVVWSPSGISISMWLLVTYLRWHALALAIYDLCHERISRELRALQHEWTRSGLAEEVAWCLFRAARATALPPITDSKRAAWNFAQIHFNCIWLCAWSMATCTFIRVAHYSTRAFDDVKEAYLV